MKDNIIVKLIGSLIMVVIMGFIIFFVYQYYDKEARSKSNDSSHNKVVVDNETEDKKPKDNSYKFVDFNKSREILYLDNKKVILDYELTDGGNVVTVNDLAVSYVPSDSTIKYLLTNYYLIIYIDNTEESDYVAIVNNDGEVLKDYYSLSINGSAYIIGNPIHPYRESSHVFIKNNTLYIVYVDNNYRIGSFNKEAVQFTYTFDITKNEFYKEERIIDKYYD